MKSSTKNLTVGSIPKLIAGFALPIFLGHIFQNLYNSVDSIVVGQFVSTTGLAAVSSGSDISMLLNGFFTGLSAGTGVVFARYFGAKDWEKLHKSIHTAVCFALIIGVIMAALGVVFTPALLRLVDCPDDVFAEACTYLRVYLVGIFFTAMYNVGAGVLRAVGDSRRPFYFLVVASIINIILDLLTVTVLHMGVLGVALATVVSQAVSVVMVFGIMLRTRDVYRLQISDLKIDGKLLAEVIDLGIPTAIQSSLLSLSNLFVQRFINGFGAEAMAGIGAAKKVDKFVGIVGQSIGMACSTFVSQNLGAKDEKRAFRGIRICFGMGEACILVMIVPLFIFARTFIELFTPDAQAVAYGVDMMHVMLPMYLVLNINQVYSNAVRGFGRSRAVMVLTLLGTVVCRQAFLNIAMKLNYDVWNIYYSFPVGWASASLLTIVYFVLVILLPRKRARKAALLQKTESDS